MEYSADLFYKRGGFPAARSFLLGTTLNMLSLLLGSSMKGFISISLLMALFVFIFDNLSVISNYE